MFVTAILTTFGTLSVGFYLRFFVALCKDRSLERRVYWVQSSGASYGGGERRQETEVTKRAA
jgi:hypothetical protein